MATRDDQDPPAQAVGEFLAEAPGPTDATVRRTTPGQDASIPTSTATRPPNLAEALDAVLAEEARKERERASTERSRRRTIPWWLTLVMLTGSSGYIWFGEPAVLAITIEPATPPATPIASRRTLVSIALLIAVSAPPPDGCRSPSASSA